jgi:hypothetical protein
MHFMVSVDIAVIHIHPKLTARTNGTIELMQGNISNHRRAAFAAAFD